MRRGLSWNALGLVLDKGGGLAVRLLLARILAPEYFGLLAMVVVFQGFFLILADLGIKNALIQRPRDSDTPVLNDTAFWFLSFSSLAWSIFFALIVGPVIVWLYDEPRLVTIAAVMALTLAFEGFSSVAEIRLSRRMKFKSLVIAELTGTVIASTAALGLAWQGAGVWALVALQVVRAATRSLFIWIFARWRPRMRFQWEKLRNLTRLSGYMLGNKIAAFVRGNIDNLLIGALLGATALGIYALAFMLTETIRVQIGNIIGRVMYSAYSRLHGDRKEVKRLYLKVVNYTALAVFPITISLFALADPIIRFGFGEEWVGAIVPLRILAVASALIALAGNPSDVLRGLGLPEVSFRIQMTTTFGVAVPGIAMGAFFSGLAGAACGILAAAIVSRSMFMVALGRELSLTNREYFSNVRSAFGLGGALAALFSVAGLIVDFS